MLRKTPQVALLLLVVILPLQGIAAIVNALCCGGLPDHHERTGFTDGNVHHHTSAPHEHAGHDGSGQSDSTHVSCQHFSPTIPATQIALDSSALPEFQASISLLSMLFFPEQPRRPPRI